MGNGYTIASVLGKQNIMNNIKKHLSTLLDRKIGSAAALKTIEIMEKINHGSYFKKSEYIMKNWIKIAKKYKIKIKVSGLPALCSFYFESKNNNAYKTFITQEMLKYGLQ